jgi:hypothetical protein
MSLAQPKTPLSLGPLLFSPLSTWAEPGPFPSAPRTFSLSFSRCQLGPTCRCLPFLPPSKRPIPSPLFLPAGCASASGSAPSEPHPSRTLARDQALSPSSLEPSPPERSRTGPLSRSASSARHSFHRAFRGHRGHARPASAGPYLASPRTPLDPNLLEHASPSHRHPCTASFPPLGVR